MSSSPNIHLYGCWMCTSSFFAYKMRHTPNMLSSWDTFVRCDRSTCYRVDGHNATCILCVRCVVYVTVSCTSRSVWTQRCSKRLAVSRYRCTRCSLIWITFLDFSRLHGSKTINNFDKMIILFYLPIYRKWHLKFIYLLFLSLTKYFICTLFSFFCEVGIVRSICTTGRKSMHNTKLNEQKRNRKKKRERKMHRLCDE